MNFRSTTCQSPVADWMPSCASFDRLCLHRFCGFRPTLKKVLRALGDVRDLDVALLDLETFSRELPKSDRESVEPLKQHLVSECGRARARMLSVLDSVSVQRNLQKLTSLLTAHSAALEQSSQKFALNVAPELIRRRYRKVRRARTF